MIRITFRTNIWFDTLHWFILIKLGINGRNLIKYMGQLGIVLWGQVLGHLWPTQQVVSFIFQWRNCTFCCLELRFRKLLNEFLVHRKWWIYVKPFYHYTKPIYCLLSFSFPLFLIFIELMVFFSWKYFI